MLLKSFEPVRCDSFDIFPDANLGQPQETVNNVCYSEVSLNKFKLGIILQLVDSLLEGKSRPINHSTWKGVHISNYLNDFAWEVVVLQPIKIKHF